MVGQDISRREGLCLALSRLGSFATSSFRAILWGEGGGPVQQLEQVADQHVQDHFCASRQIDSLDV